MVKEEIVKDAIVDFLKNIGFIHIVPEYTINGYDADFVATDEHKLIAIECKGTGGRFQEALGQAIIYKRACDSVFLAIPNMGFNFTKFEESICKKEGIGVIQCHFDAKDQCTKTEIILEPRYDPQVADLETRFEILNDLLFEKKGKGRDPLLGKIHRVCEVITLIAQGNNNRQILREKLLERPKINKESTANMAIRMAQILEMTEEETKQTRILSVTGRYIASLLHKWSDNVLEDLAYNPTFSDSDPIQAQLLSVFRLKCFNFRLIREVYRVLEKERALDENSTLNKNQIIAASSHHRPKDIDAIVFSSNYLEQLDFVKSTSSRPKGYFLNPEILFY